MTPGIVTVHLVFPDAITQEEALACLTEDEKTQAGRYRFQKDAMSWIACRASLRKILGTAISCPPLEVPLVFSGYGKPTLAQPYERLHFNLSHCKGLAIVAVTSEGPVGIDLEPIYRAESLLECETSFCHPEEISELPHESSARALQLLRIWTAKEAVLKALGTGLSHAPEKVRILFGQPPGTAISDVPLVGMGNQRLHRLDHPALKLYQAVLSVPQSVTRIEIV